MSAGFTVGLDLGDRVTHFTLLDTRGEVVERGTVATTRDALRSQFQQLPPSRVVLEVSTHSPWVSEMVRTNRSLRSNASQVGLRSS